MSQDNPALPINRTRPGKRVAWAILCLLLAAAAAVAIWQLFLKPKPTVTAAAKVTATVQRGTLTISGSASGTTAKGIQSQTVNWSAGSADLVVEKVFKAAGDTVAQGDALLKLTDASVSEVRTQLEADVAAAKIALAQAEIDHQTASVEAKLDYDSNLALKAAAKQVYNETIQSLADALAAAKDALTTAKAYIHDNPSLIATQNKSIATAESNLTAAQNAVSAAQASLAAADGPYRKASEAAQMAASSTDKARYALDWAQKYATDQAIDPADPAFAPFLIALQNELSAKEALEADAKAALDKAKAPYDLAKAALSQSQTNVATLQQSLSTLNKDLTARQSELDQSSGNLANLQARYDQAISDQKSKTIMASQTYSSSIQAGDDAQTIYDLAVMKSDQALADAKSTLSSDEKALDLFSTSIGDGTIRAAYAGTITSIGYAADGVLTAATPVATFNNAAVLTVSASVDQADISSLSVGKQVTVTFSSSTARGGYQGKITGITMKAASTSISAVKYTVTVTVDGDVTNLTAGQTVTIRFVKDSLTNVLYVDQKAILKNTSGTYVDKQVNGQVSQVPVTIGENNGQFTAVLSGLSEGDVCVYTGTASATSGNGTASATSGNGTASSARSGTGTGSTSSSASGNTGASNNAGAGGRTGSGTGTTGGSAPAASTGPSTATSTATSTGTAGKT